MKIPLPKCISLICLLLQKLHHKLNFLMPVPNGSPQSEVFSHEHRHSSPCHYHALSPFHIRAHCHHNFFFDNATSSPLHAMSCFGSSSMVSITQCPFLKARAILILHHLTFTLTPTSKPPNFTNVIICYVMLWLYLCGDNKHKLHNALSSKLGQF